MINWYLQSGKESDVVVSSRIRLSRNINEFTFTTKYKKSDSLKIISILEEVLPKLRGEEPENNFEEFEEDFELSERPITYEVWILGYDENYEDNDFEFLLDDGYTDLAEAKKCFDYFTNPENLKAYLDLKNVKILEGTKHINLFLEECVQLPDSDLVECDDILEEVEVEIL